MGVIIDKITEFIKEMQLDNILYEEVFNSLSKEKQSALIGRKALLIAGLFPIVEYPFMHISTMFFGARFFRIKMT